MARTERESPMTTATVPPLIAPPKPLAMSCMSSPPAPPRIHSGKRKTNSSKVETHRPHHHAADAVDAVEVDHCAMRVPALLNARTAGGCCQRRIQRPSCPSSWNPPNRGRLHSCKTAERWSSRQGPEGPTAERSRDRRTVELATRARGPTAERSRKRWERNDG